MVFLSAEGSSTVREEGIIRQLFRVPRIDDATLAIKELTPRIQNQVDAFLLCGRFASRNCLGPLVRTSATEKDEREWF